MVNVAFHGWPRFSILAGWLLMASTLKLLDTINWAQPFLRFAPLTIGANNEPAITCGNIVLSTILGPPFTWRWNRNTVSVTLSAGIQDYSQAVSDFGFIETASVGTSSGFFEIRQIKNQLPKTSTNTSFLGRPNFVAAQNDDNAGNITFRFVPVPDASIGGNAASITYQKKPTLFTTGAGSTTNVTWAPIPDEYSYVYNHGFLAMCMLYWDDPRWQVELPRFLSSLIGISEGLSETQKNIFLENWMGSQLQIHRLGGLAQQGTVGPPTVGGR